MPKVIERTYYSGAEQRIARLGLTPLLAELEAILMSFELRVEEKRNANGGAEVRKMIDAAFERAGGWTKQSSGDVDWTKCRTVNGTSLCLGVEVQVSGRSDAALTTDIVHLRDRINAGDIDLGVLVVPTDQTSVFLVDRGPSFSAAQEAVKRARAQDDMPLAILAIEHDGPGPALPKQETRQGKTKKKKSPSKPS